MKRHGWIYTVAICLVIATMAAGVYALFAPAAFEPSASSLTPKHLEQRVSRESDSDLKGEISSENSKESESKPESSETVPIPEIESAPQSGKIAYLTFDDGPTPKTPEVLKVLKEKGVTATFFAVFHSNSDQYYQQIVDSGCQLAVHAYEHNYKKLYAVPESFFSDFYKMQAYLQKFTGAPITDFRFPGGSSQTVTDKKMFCKIILETQKHGLRYFDWNVSAGDATNAKIDTDYVYNNIIPAAFKYNYPVILMHERSPYTREALPKIIDALKQKGYQFGQIKDLAVPVQHRTPAYAEKVLKEQSGNG